MDDFSTSIENIRELPAPMDTRGGPSIEPGTQLDYNELIKNVEAPSTQVENTQQEQQFQQQRQPQEVPPQHSSQYQQPQFQQPQFQEPQFQEPQFQQSQFQQSQFQQPQLQHPQLEHPQYNQRYEERQISPHYAHDEFNYNVKKQGVPRPILKKHNKEKTYDKLQKEFIVIVVASLLVNSHYVQEMLMKYIQAMNKNGSISAIGLLVNACLLGVLVVLSKNLNFSVTL